MAAISNEQILKLIEAGIQAPSADNCQPWKFKVLDDGFELWMDHSRMGLFFDVEQVATKISCGAVLENVATLAKSMGFEADISYFDGPGDKNSATSKFAQVSFGFTGNADDAEAVRQTIFDRHTNRNLFQFNKTIPDGLLAELARIVDSNRQYRFYRYEAPRERGKIIQTVVATDTIRFIHQQVHNDFYKVLRFGETAQKTRDGLAAATLGIEPFLIPILALLKPWKLTRFFNYIGLHHVMAFRGTWLPMKSASLILSIVHKGPADYVDFGQVMQRFWLQANKAGLSIQPLGALPLFLARLHMLQGEGFSSQQLQTLNALEDGFASITSSFNKETDQIVMLFRAGYTKKSAPRPYRRELESFLLR